MKKEIVILGFPKCGTTALLSAFISDPEVEVLKPPSGGLEVQWPLIQELDKGHIQNCKIICHKYVAYIYSTEALAYLVASNPESILTLLIRHPLKSLYSWHKMHQSIAISGRYPNHFAYKERDFYAACSIEDYYEKFAKNKLDYYKHLKNLMAIVPPERLVVINHNNLSSNMELIVDYLKKLSGGVKSSPVFSTEITHSGYADKINVDELSNQLIKNELNKIYENVSETVQEHVKKKIWF
jgi:hypothetical protein